MDPIKARGEGSITLSGRTYKLKTSFSAFVRIEEALGVGVLTVCDRFRRLEVRHKDLGMIVYHLALEGLAAGEKISMGEVGKGLMDDGIDAMMAHTVTIMSVLKDALSAGSKEAGAGSPN
jgi:hypothetical protein